MTCIKNDIKRGRESGRSQSAFGNQDYNCAKHFALLALLVFTLKGSFMRQNFALRLLSGAALVAFLSLGTVFHAGAEDAVKAASAEPSEPFDISNIMTFSGAYLAGNNADTERDRETAIKLYNKALIFEPDNTEIKERLLLALLTNGNLDEGAKIAEELKNDQGVERVTVIVRALDAMRKGNFTLAETILKYDGPNDLDRLTNGLLTAWAKVGRGDTKTALADLAALKGPPWFSIFKSYTAGLIAANANDTDTARKMLNDAVTDREGASTATDTFMRAVEALANLEAKSGNQQKALNAVSAGEAVLGNFSPLKALRQSIEGGKAGNVGIANATEGAASVLFSIAAALNQTINDSGANDNGDDVVLIYLQAANALAPNVGDTLVLLGGVAERQKQPEKAIAFYNQVPATSPMRRLSELQLGLVLSDTGKVEEAKAHLKGLVAADPSDIRSYLAYGSVLSESKEYQAMADNYNQAVAQIGATPNRSHWSVFYQRGIAFERLKQWDKAEPDFLKALELNPDQPQVLNYLGYSWVDMNINLEKGLDMIKKAVELRPDDGYIVDSLGWAYYRLGKFEDAVKQLEHAVELKENDATINDHLGDAYWRVGRKLEAGFQWKRSLQAKPEPEDAKRIQEKLNSGLPEIAPVETDKKAAAGTASEPEKTVIEPQTKSDVSPAGSQTQVPLEPLIHTVTQGDSLWKIAKEKLGDATLFRAIIEANPVLQKNPNALKLGQPLIIPAAAQ